MRYHLLPFLIPKDQNWWRIQVGTGIESNYKGTEETWKTALEIIRKKWYERIWYQPWLGWEVHATWDETRYYYWTPTFQLGEQFFEAWAGQHDFVKITHESPPPLDFHRPHAGAKLMLSQNFCVPLKIFTDPSDDSMTSLLQFLTYLEEGDRAVVQMLVKPVYESQVDKEFRKVISIIEKNKEDPLNENEEYIKAVMEKYQKPKGEVAIKLIYFSDSYERAKFQMDQFVKAFGVFDSEKFNGIDRRRWWKIFRPLFRYEAKNRIFPIRMKKNAMILGTDEIAGLLRTPQSGGSSRFFRLPHRQAPADAQLRKYWSTADPSKHLHLGHNEFHYAKFETYQPLSDAEKHTLVIGGPGMGKTMFLVNYIEQFLKFRTPENRYGMTIIDPSGQLTHELMTRISPEEHDRFRVYEFRDKNVPFNIFDHDAPISDNKKARTALGAIKKYDNSFWTPEVEENLLNAGIALTKLDMASTGNLQKLLENDEFRHHVISLLDENDEDQFGLKEYFRRYDEMDHLRQDFLKGNAMTKLRNLNLSPVGSMLNFHSSAPKWYQALEEGWIQIFDLSGLMAKEKSFISSVIFSFMQVAMNSRFVKGTNRRIPKEQLPYHPLVADNAAMIIENHYSKLEFYLEEARRQRVPFVFSVEGLHQLIKPELMDAFYRSFGTIAAFQLGNPQDAEIVSQNLNNFHLTPEDFKSVEPGYCYAQMPMEKDDLTKVFLLRPNQLEPGQFADQIEEVRRSTKRYMAEVENKTRRKHEELAKKRFTIYQEQMKANEEELKQSSSSEDSKKVEKAVAQNKLSSEGKLPDKPMTKAKTQKGKAKQEKSKQENYSPVDSDNLDSFIKDLYGFSVDSKKVD